MFIPYTTKNTAGLSIHGKDKKHNCHNTSNQWLSILFCRNTKCNYGEDNFQVEQGHGIEHKTPFIGLASELDFLMNLKPSDKFITPN